MKRTEINAILSGAAAFFRRNRFKLPAWAAWSPKQWKNHMAFAKRVKSLQMGWDVTDFGTGDFEKTGLVLFCIRNGGPANGKKYAEKIMVVREGQLTPLHFHFKKKEDIINRGGGVLAIEMFNADKKEGLAKSMVRVRVDEMERTLKPGKPLFLHPGESITLVPGLYHRFYGVKGKGKVLVGEVSDVNDDNSDNRFYEPMGRFPSITENAAPLYPLWKEV